jgi:flavin reductase (DIM6/NTAB) family NADH-FMN oxidoreductase RutF
MHTIKVIAISNRIPGNNCREDYMKIPLGAKTLVYPTPVLVVGTYDRAGKPNIMTAAWGGICCSKPPCVALSLRKATYTYDCIVNRQAYTISMPSEAHAREADYSGIVSGKNTDKFMATGLTPVRSDLVDAPYVEEFPVVLECRLLHTFEIGLHTQFIGEIIDVKADESVLGDNGMPDILKIKPLVFDPGNTGYYGIGTSIGKAFSIGKTI